MRKSMLIVIDMCRGGPMQSGMQMDALHAVLREAFMARPKATGAGRG